MNDKLVQKPDLENADHLTLIVGLSCRDLRGFLFMWINIFSFIGATKRAEGCTHILPGVISPFSIVLVSYWGSRRSMMHFVKSPAHLRWMRFIDRHSASLSLFNETYGRPESANFIHKPRGYAGSLISTKEGKPR